MTTEGIASRPALLGGAITLLPTRRVLWGVGARHRVGEELEAVGARRVLLLSTRSLVEQGRLVGDVEAALGTACLGSITSIPAHAPASSVDRAVESYRASLADAIVTVGGGSVVDAGKAVAARVIDAGEPVPWHVTLPTTLSAAEFSHLFGVSELVEDGALHKRGHVRPEVTPPVVILDPELTVATPEQLWTSTGIKALDHAIEGVLATDARPVVDVTALEGIRRMRRELPASRHPEALEERMACQLAAWHCFMAPAATPLGLSHRLGHVLGGRFGVPHGMTSCVTLPAVMRAMEWRHVDRLDQIARALGQVPAPRAAAAAVEELVAQLDLPRRLRDLGLELDDRRTLGRLVVEQYPDAVAGLGPDGEERLNVLLKEAW